VLVIRPEIGNTLLRGPEKNCAYQLQGFELIVLPVMSVDETVPRTSSGSLVPGTSTAFEEIIQIYLRDVDRTLIRENLALTPAQRLQKLEEFVEFLESAKKTRRTASETDKDAKPI
jgi:hypothetical protein